MPIYEYRCQECHHEFERMQKFSDPPVAVCPTCAGAVQKLISRSAFHLKGSGWYVTDYARNGGQKSESSSEKGASDKTTGEKSTSEKSDGKASASASSESGSESTAKKTPSGTAAA